MKIPTKFELLQACSNNFLTTEIPDNFLDLDEFQQYQFLSTHAWRPVENLSPDQIWQLIESSADTMSSFLVQKCDHTSANVEHNSSPLYIFTVEVDLDALTKTYLEGTDATQPDTISSMIEYECGWLQLSGLSIKNILPLDGKQVE